MAKTNLTKYQKQNLYYLIQILYAIEGRVCSGGTPTLEQVSKALDLALTIRDFPKPSVDEHGGN